MLPKPVLTWALYGVQLKVLQAEFATCHTCLITMKSNSAYDPKAVPGLSVLALASGRPLDLDNLSCTRRHNGSPQADCTHT